MERKWLNSTHWKTLEKVLLGSQFVHLTKTICKLFNQSQINHLDQVIPHWRFPSVLSILCLLQCNTFTVFVSFQRNSSKIFRTAAFIFKFASRILHVLSGFHVPYLHLVMFVLLVTFCCSSFLAMTVSCFFSQWTWWDRCLYIYLSIYYKNNHR